MTPDIIAQTDFFFWNNFTGLYRDTMNEFEGEIKTLQDIIYIMLDTYTLMILNKETLVY